MIQTHQTHQGGRNTVRLVLCSLLLLAACTSHELRCDAHLMPINVPAPAQAPGAGTAAVRAPADRAPPDSAPSAVTPSGGAATADPSVPEAR
jgi:hypothetical protein